MHYLQKKTPLFQNTLFQNTLFWSFRHRQYITFFLVCKGMDLLIFYKCNVMYVLCWGLDVSDNQIAAIYLHMQIFMASSVKQSNIFDTGSVTKQHNCKTLQLSTTLSEGMQILLVLYKYQLVNIVRTVYLSLLLVC